VTNVFGIAFRRDKIVTFQERDLSASARGGDMANFLCRNVRRRYACITGPVTVALVSVTFIKVSCCKQPCIVVLTQ
jgi:hypothetical protein